MPPINFIVPPPPPFTKAKEMDNTEVLHSWYPEDEATMGMAQ